VLLRRHGWPHWLGKSRATQARRITSEYLKKLSEGERSYYGVGKDSEPNGFVVDAGMEKIDRLLPKAFKTSSCKGIQARP